MEVESEAMPERVGRKPGALDPNCRFFAIHGKKRQENPSIRFALAVNGFHAGLERGAGPAKAQDEIREPSHAAQSQTEPRVPS